ncbi:MAG TPA: hypothetical protein VI749_02635 [Candidatus Omnitrophota bacterium]|nr:hypothetical protein [Candidatus Omnitrophota bacterium]
MKKNIVCICLIAGFVLGQQAKVTFGERLFTRNNQIFNLRGFIVEIDQAEHILVIEDELTRIRHRFYVHYKNIDRFQGGDEVRVYYRSGSYEALSITKMTPVEYIEEKQNKGYLLKSKEGKE